MTVKNSLKHLETLDLIERKKQGFGKPDIIYVKIPEIKNSPKADKTCPSHELNSVSLNGQNLSPSNTNINYTEYSKTLKPRKTKYKYNNDGGDYSL